MTNTKKYLSMLGMARRAGRISMGHDMAVKAVKSRSAEVLIFASDVSDRLVKEFDVTREKYFPELPALSIAESIDEIHMALGYKAGVMTVDDKNFSSRIIELINQEENAYGNKD